MILKRNTSNVNIKIISRRPTKINRKLRDVYCKGILKLIFNGGKKTMIIFNYILIKSNKNICKLMSIYNRKLQLLMNWLNVKEIKNALPEPSNSRWPLTWPHSSDARMDTEFPLLCFSPRQDLDFLRHISWKKGGGGFVSSELRWKVLFSFCSYRWTC